MGWVSGVVVFLLIWWVVIFTILPWSLKRDEGGRPDDPRLWKKVVLTSCISLLLWIAVDALISSDLINFRDIAEKISQEDRGK